MFVAQHLHHALPRLCAVVVGLQHPSLLALGDPPHRRPEFTADHQAMKGLGPVLRGFFPVDGSEVLSGGPQRVLHQHRELARLPRVEAFLNPSPNIPGCCDMAGPLECHRLKDDEALRVPPPVQHPPQLPHQDVDKTPPNLPTRRLVVIFIHQ